MGGTGYTVPGSNIKGSPPWRGGGGLLFLMLARIYIRISNSMLALRLQFSFLTENSEGYECYKLMKKKIPEVSKSNIHGHIRGLSEDSDFNAGGVEDHIQLLRGCILFSLNIPRMLPGILELNAASINTLR